MTTNNPRVRITLEFEVHEPEALLQKANQMVVGCWNSSLTEIYSENFLAAAVVEMLLHSNPDIKSYVDYGIEIMDQSLSQVGWDDSQLPLFEEE